MAKNLIKTLLFLFVVIGDAFAIEKSTVVEKLAKLETASNGRLGVAAVNMEDGKQIQYRAHERFAMCSTSKFMVTAAILQKSMGKNFFLQKNIKYKKDDLITHSPITEKHLDDGMTIQNLCAAAMTTSDNTAMNLLLKNLGEPQVVTAFARSIGDKEFRLDRYELDLNTAIPNDVRDTTTPAAMADDIQKLALGDILWPLQRGLLLDWLKNNTTGDSRIRAGVSKGWVVGDKTGTGDYGTTNDIGIIWPPNHQPIVLAIYFTQNKKDALPNDKVIAEATRIVIEGFANKK